MKFRSKPHEVDAFRFDGTFLGYAGLQAALDFCSSHDLEDVEVSSQGTAEPLALDVIDARGIRTLESGDYIYVKEGKLCCAFRQEFEDAYEQL